MNTAYCCIIKWFSRNFAALGLARTGTSKGIFFPTVGRREDGVRRHGQPFISGYPPPTSKGSWRKASLPQPLFVSNSLQYISMAMLSFPCCVSCIHSQPYSSHCSQSRQPPHAQGRYSQIFSKRIKLDKNDTCDVHSSTHQPP